MKTNEILNQISKASDNVKAIEKQLFTVVKKPLFTKDERYKPITTHFGIYKEGGGIPLGVMGTVFEPNQPKDIFNVIQNIALENDIIDLSKTKFKEYQNGSIIEFRQPLEDVTFDNVKGVKEVLKIELLFQTSFNGSISNRIQLYVTRLVCLNGMTATNVEAKSIFRNTKNSNKKSLYFLSKFAKLLSDKDAYISDLIKLNQVEIDDEKIEEFINTLIDFNPEVKATTRKLNIKKQLLDSINLEVERTGKTLFGFLQGVTYYTNHIIDKGDEYLLFSGGKKMNDKAQNLVFAELN